MREALHQAFDEVDRVAMDGQTRVWSMHAETIFFNRFNVICPIQSGLQK